MTRKLSSLCIVLLLASVGCEDEVVTSNAPPTQQAKGRKAAKKKKKEDEKKKKAALPVFEVTEADFVESEENRDPFRSYEYLFVDRTRAKRRVQRKVKAVEHALETLKLSGIITRGPRRALFIDGTGLGWMLYPGDFVGKSEVVSAAGTDGQDVEINWRVDRIRPKDVVFIREDAAHPEIPPSTKVVPLYPAGDPGASG